MVRWTDLIAGPPSPRPCKPLQTQRRAPRREASGLCQILPPKEGVGNAGRPVHPQPRVRKWWLECTRVFTASSPDNARHPHAMVYGLYRALPGDRAFLPPSPADYSTGLTPASGCQDHTVLPSASAPFVKSASASTASRPTFVTIASAPPTERDGETSTLICGFGKSEYFFKGG